MRAFAQPVITVVTAFLLGACAAPRATPPPAEPYTAFAPVEVKVKSDPDWLAAGFGSVWLKRPEGFVDRIDAAGATLTTTIDTDATDTETCSGIGPGIDAMWSCSFHDLVRIDPATDTVVATIPVGKIPGQGRIVRAADRVWVLAGEGDRLVGVAESDGSISDPIALPVSCHDLGAAPDVVYVVCERADRVLRVDLAQSAVTAVTVRGPTWVSAAASGIWVTTGSSLLRLDPLTLATTLTLDGVGAGGLNGIAADEGGVWIRASKPFLTRVDAATGRISRVISGPFESGGDVLADGDVVWATDLDGRLVLRLEVPAAS